MGLRSARNLCVLWTATLYACGSGGPEPAAPTWTSPAEFSESGVPAPLSLRCDWVDGSRMRVEVRRNLIRNGQQALAAEARWRMTIAREGRETVVHTTELSADEIQAQLPEDRLNAAVTIFNFIPSSRWTPDLETLELLDVGTTVAMVENVGRVVAPPALRENAVWSSIAPMFSGDATILERQADNQLLALTSFHGMTFEPGEAVRSRSAATTNLGVETPMTSTTRLLGMGPCFLGDAADGCVSVEVTTSADTESFQAVVGERGVLHSIRGVFRLLAEPATLMPHRVVFTKSTRFSVRVGDEVQDASETDEVTWLYRYPLPRRSGTRGRHPY